MANYSFPPFYHPSRPQQQQQQQQQQPPGTMNQEAYTNQPYASSPQVPPQYQQPFSGIPGIPGIPGMEMSTPVLDQNQMAYFWQQLASGNPALPANVPLPQTSPVQPTPFSFPPYAPPPPPLPIPQQTQPAPIQSSPVLDANLQHSRVNELGRPDREEGEVSEDGEVSTADVRTAGSWKNGRRANNNRKTDPRGKANQGTPRTAPPSQQRANLRKENVSFQTPKAQPKQGKKNPSAPRSQPASTTKPPVPKHQAKKRNLRQEAMDAVSGLHAHGITYPALAEESIFDGFDKNLLRQLFKDAGIPLEEPPPKQDSPPQKPKPFQEPTVEQANPLLSPKGIDPAWVNLLSQGGMNLDHETLAKLAKAMGQSSPAKSPLNEPVKQQGVPSGQSIIPGLAPSSEPKQSTAKSSDEVVKIVQQSKTVPEQKTTSSAGQPSAREAYLAKLAAAKNKKKGARIPGPASGESAKPVVQQPSQAPIAVVKTTAAKVSTSASTPAKQSVKQGPIPSSVPNAGGSTPSRSMVKMDVLQRKLDAERKAKQAQESAKANAQPVQLPPSRSDSISSIEYNQSNSGSAQSGAGMGEAQENWTQPESAYPNTDAQAVVVPNPMPSIPGLSLGRGEAATQPLQAASSRQAPPLIHSLPARPEPSNTYQNQPTHVLPPRPPPVASILSSKPSVQAPRSQAWQPEGSKKRPASAVSGPPSFAPAKRQHEYTWNNKYNRPAIEADESVVIDISSDDDDGDDMEIDDEFQATTAAPANKSLPVQKLLANRAVPPGLSGPNSALVSPAAVSTPDAIGTAQSGNQQRLDELAEMKRRLQEQLKRKQELKKSRLTSSGHETPVLSSANVPSSPVVVDKAVASHAQIGPETTTAESSINTPTNKPRSATSQVMSTPMLSSPQPSGRRSGLEAEISNDELLLQQMQKKMEEMQAKIKRNKTELAQELEGIGINTQGMSMETMEAVKEDIAQATQDDAAAQLPEPKANATLVPGPALPVDLDTQMVELDSEEEEGEIDENQGVSQDALPHVYQDEVPESSGATNTILLAKESASLAAVSHVTNAIVDTPVLEAVEDIDDRMSESSDSSSEAEDDDEDDNEDYEPEAPVVPVIESNADDDSHDDKMSTSSESSRLSDSDNDIADDAQLPIHEQAIVEESSEDSDSSDEDDIYKTTLEAPAQSDVDVGELETEGVATETKPDFDQIPKKPTPEVVNNASASSEEGEISEDDNEPDSALQLQHEATGNEEEEDYEPDVVSVSTTHADAKTSGSDLIAAQAENTAVPESNVSEAAPTAPSAAAITGHGFVLPGLGSTIAYTAQPATAPTGPSSAVTQDQVMEDDEAVDFEPSVVAAAPQPDEIPSDDDADLYEPLPVDAGVEASAEIAATTGATEAGLSSDEEEPMLVDDGNVQRSPPKTDHEVDVTDAVKLVPGIEAVSISKSAASTPADTTQLSTPIPDVGTPSPDASNLSSVIADDLAPELRPSADAINSTASATPSVPPAHFVPYSSPLRMFKAYRYHSNFRNDVAGGFKSLTYSNTIDPGLPLCPIEMAGANCDDPNCVGQHMRDMGLPDNMILVQLGSLNPGRTDEDKKRWADGLRTLIGNLRAQGVKETDVVASQIASYRRNFFNDPSRIFDI